ncbi:CDP-diacylglycerol--glycerol-3-phosphate 3-phosphatidyltransferase [Geminicoccus sp.]|uniref:CDP-diacylglycerol--glycerol-3-phosphate 3-phosphatidyltransferase n=1 Tax=Geminicoccus sp. TaxID=2024832 RepID=UPI0032C23270
MQMNLPNMLTLFRIALIPVVMAMFYVDGAWARWVACAIFLLAATTDLLDGWIARNWRLQSDFGRWLDPVADKLLVGATVVMLAGFHRAPLIPAVVIILREVAVSGLREYMAEVRVGMPVTPLAKWKTTVQMVAIVFLILGPAGPDPLPTETIGFWGLWLAAALTLLTGWDYLQAGLRHMAGEPPPPPHPPEPAGVRQP